MDHLPADLPAPVIPTAVAPRRGPNLKPLLVIVLAIFLVLLIAFVGLNKLSPVRKTVPPVPSATPAVSSAQPPSSGGVPRLPLTNLAGHQLITVYSDKLWLTEFTLQGPNRSLLSDPMAKVLDLMISPDKNRLAYTFTDGTNKSGLRVYDFRDKSVTEFIGLSDNQFVRYPVWSADNLYLAVWNSGNGDTLYDMTTKRKLLEIPASGGSILGPIVFVTGRIKISYVDGNKIYESDYTGDNKTQIVDQVYSANPPDPYFYSGDASFIAFHNLLGQLVVFNRNDSSLQTLAEGSGAGHSYGQAITFYQNNLIYYDLKKSNYTPGIDPNPVYSYRVYDKAGQPLIANRLVPMALGSPLIDTANSKILIHYQGYRIYDFTGRLVSNCDDTDLGYDQVSHDIYSSPLRYWSADGKFVLNSNATEISDVSTCALSAPYDPETPEAALWLK